MMNTKERGCAAPVSAPNAKPSTRTKKSNANTNKPKRPLSAYNLFYRFKRQAVIALGSADKDTISRTVRAPPGLEHYPSQYPSIALADDDATSTANDAPRPPPPRELNGVRRRNILSAMELNIAPRDTRDRSHRTNSKAMNGAMSFLELGKLMNVCWQRCDEFAKDVFRELADRGREIYKVKLGEFNGTITPSPSAIQDSVKAKFDYAKKDEAAKIKAAEKARHSQSLPMKKKVMAGAKREHHQVSLLNPQYKNGVFPNAVHAGSLGPRGPAFVHQPHHGGDGFGQFYHNQNDALLRMMASNINRDPRLALPQERRGITMDYPGHPAEAYRHGRTLFGRVVSGDHDPEINIPPKKRKYIMAMELQNRDPRLALPHEGNVPPPRDMNPMSFHHQAGKAVCQSRELWNRDPRLDLPQEGNVPPPRDMSPPSFHHQAGMAPYPGRSRVNC